MQVASSKPQRKIQAQLLADRITTSFNLMHQRKTVKERKKLKKNQLSTNLTLYEVNKNQWTNLKRAEIKRNKEFNIEAWEKEASNTIS